MWQRFLMASSLLFGLLIGVVATVFGYSNLGSVDVHWSVFHIDGVPLWTVAVVPLAVFLVAGTLYHWFNSLHHFTEHMRHRRRVHELEAEVSSLRTHLDQVLEMPDQSSSRLPARHVTAEPAPGPEEERAAASPVTASATALLEAAPAASNGGAKPTRRALPRRKVAVEEHPETEPTTPAEGHAEAAEPEVAKEAAEPAADPVEA